MRQITAPLVYLVRIYQVVVQSAKCIAVICCQMVAIVQHATIHSLQVTVDHENHMEEKKNQRTLIQTTVRYSMMRDQTIQKTFILKILEIMFLMMVAQVAKKEVLIQTESLKETALNNKILNLLFLCYIRFYKFHSYTALD